MKRTTTILSKISIIIAVLALLYASALLLIFWEQVCFTLYHLPEDIVAEGPMLPLGNTVSMIGSLILVLMVHYCSRSSKHMVGEVVAIVFSVVALPILASFLSVVQTAIVGSVADTQTTITALSVATSISDKARGMMDVASSLCLVVCGMSIAQKKGTIERDRNNSPFVG